MLNLQKLGNRLFTTRALDNWKSKSDKFNDKIKGTIVEKWVKYWKTLAKDYKDVGLSAKQDIQSKPLKSTLYFTGAAFVGLCIELNPDLQRAKYIESANDLSLVSSALVNPESVDHLKRIERCFNRKYIRYVNLGVLSLIWVDKYSNECDSYESNCSYLQVPYLNITQRILDIGFLNVWWITSRKMLNYDINY